MRLLVIAALLPLAASFASTPEPPKPYEPPEGLVLIRDSYQFDNAEHAMKGLVPDSPGPHKLIVYMTGADPTAYETEFGHVDAAFDPRRGTIEKFVAMQGPSQTTLLGTIKEPGILDCPATLMVGGTSHEK